MSWWRALSGLIGFMQVPASKKRLVFYCEGKNYWPHLQGILETMLATTDISLCYLSSDLQDPGLQLSHERKLNFFIGEGSIRNWLFENIETEILVMTMPDLQQYQVKRSRFPVHYVYVQHSLVSLHMIYREGAFDYYDTIFCAGPHHVHEMKALEKLRNLSPKVLLEHGYGRFDTLLEVARTESEVPDQQAGSPEVRRQHALIAPSWGPEGTIESGVGEDIVSQLLEQGYEVTLRPHPQTIKLAGQKIERILFRFQDHEFFHYEANVAGHASLFSSDFMISDWSGAALEYAFALQKPVLFVDVPKKVNNPHWTEIEPLPFEIACMELIGKKLQKRDGLYEFSCTFSANPDAAQYIYNPGKSSAVGAKYLTGLLRQSNETP